MSDSQVRAVTFDIEIAKPLPEDRGAWDAHRPFGISCAAISDGQQHWVFAAEDRTDALTPEQARRILDTLIDLASEGLPIISFNGMGFDWPVLADECKHPACTESCRELAHDHIDMMFHVFVAKGYPVSLQALSTGMGLPGKLEGVKGADAPEMWCGTANIARAIQLQEHYHMTPGSPAARQQMIDYVVQDAMATYELYAKALQRGTLRWLSKSRGTPQALALPGGRFWTVREAMQQPVADVSWMSDPIPRTRFTEWLTG